MHQSSVESTNTYAVVGLSILTLLASESKYLLVHVMEYPLTYTCNQIWLDKHSNRSYPKLAGFRHGPFNTPFLFNRGIIK